MSGFKVIDSYKVNNDQWDLRVYMHDHAQEYHAIVKTMQGGISLQNSHGGFSVRNLGSPKYIKHLWNKMKGTK